MTTICPHNAPGQTYLTDRPTPCRQCGAPLWADANATGIAAAYPGDPTLVSIITTDEITNIPAPEA